MNFAHTNSSSTSCSREAPDRGAHVQSRASGIPSPRAHNSFASGSDWCPSPNPSRTESQYLLSASVPFICIAIHLLTHHFVRVLSRTLTAHYIALLFATAPLLAQSTRPSARQSRNCAQTLERQPCHAPSPQTISKTETYSYHATSNGVVLISISHYRLRSPQTPPRGHHQATHVEESFSSPQFTCKRQAISLHLQQHVTLEIPSFNARFLL